MNNYDLVGALRTYATTKGWAFLYGSSFMKDYEASKNYYYAGQLILGADSFIVKPNITPGFKVDTISYQGLIMLGRKFESTTTTSTLDETDIQKYDRRLLELMGTLSTNLLSFACTNELTIQGLQYEAQLNNLDENIDFIIASLTFVQG
jgi:hypothetical protein